MTFKRKKTIRLAVDIGNTAISLGLLENGRVAWVRSVETAARPAVFLGKIKTILSSLTRRYPSLEEVVICSVVPAAFAVIQNLIRKEFSLKTIVVGRDKIVPIKNHYRNPAQVGQDRLICAYAARELYGTPLIVIDFGTAITYDVVSKKGEYLGGIIVPGIRLTAESLFKKTALLPKVRIRTPRELIGRDTNNSILSGIFYGYGSLSKGLIDLIGKEIKSKPKVIITGGYSHWVKKYISYPATIDPHLVFKGMSLVLSSD